MQYPLRSTLCRIIILHSRTLSLPQPTFRGTHHIRFAVRLIKPMSICLSFISPLLPRAIRFLHPTINTHVLPPLPPYATANCLYSLTVMEYMRPDMRTVGLNACIGLFYCLGCMVLPWVALLSGEWRHFLLHVSAPILIVIPYYWLLPESARWLIDKGRVTEAVRCFKRIAAFNGRGQLPSTAVDMFTVSWCYSRVTLQ